MFEPFKKFNFGKIVIKDIEMRVNGRSVKFEVRHSDVTDLNFSNVTKLSLVEVLIRLSLLSSYFLE